jgi:hypothetical protein
MIVFPTVLSLGVCRGHLDLDNRGVRLEEYDAEVKNILKIFGFSKVMASVGLDVFTRCHTLRIEAEKLCRTRFSVAHTGPALIGKEAIPLPFPRIMLGGLTVYFNAGSLSNSNTRTYADLTNSIQNIGICFPNLAMLTIEIEWDIDEVQERFAPLYTVLHNEGGVRASESPLANIRGAHKSCKNYVKLLIELIDFRRNNPCDVRILSKGKQASLFGDWHTDLIIAGYLFPDSYAWRINGFRDWVRDYTMVHYALDEVLEDVWWSEPTVIGIEVLHLENDEDRRSDYYGYSFNRADAIAWAARYREKRALEESEIAWDKAVRESQDLVWP